MFILSAVFRLGDTMRAIYIIICAGAVGFASVNAQSQTFDNMESVIQSIAAGNTASVGDIIDDVTRTLFGTAEPAGPQISAIEGPLVIETVVPDVNQTTAAILIGDDRTGRYPPRLRIDFAEFPLRSLDADKKHTNGRTAIPMEAVAQRIQRRLRLPKVEIVVQDRTAVVSGIAETEHQRSLVESMLRFEPGIDNVKNEMIVK